SLLGDPRVIRVRTSGDKIAALLIEAIQKGDSQEEYYSARLIIEAGGLQKRSKLRAAAESAQSTACLQLFADDAGDIEQRVKSVLKAEGVEIIPEALALFVGDLPGHRNLANSEIEKLALYARGLGRPLDLNDVRALSA
ncbi:MAG TPA: DNA polymerase III subunit delta, partial [Hyphomonas atlantica]|nr:DNA polymerase III subunit delta [Hyphomonas atlantica]